MKRLRTNFNENYLLEAIMVIAVILKPGSKYSNKNAKNCQMPKKVIQKAL